MKIFNTGVASLLLEKSEELEEGHHDGWRCVYIRMHDKQERFNAMLRANFINRAVVELLENDEGYIYFCDDGDIIILFQGAVKPVMAKLSSHFGDLDPGQLRGQSDDNLFSFFDLSRHWNGFKELCNEKTADILAIREGLAHVTPAGKTRRIDMLNA